MISNANKVSNSVESSKTVQNSEVNLEHKIIPVPMFVDGQEPINGNTHVNNSKQANEEEMGKKAINPILIFLKCVKSFKINNRIGFIACYSKKNKSN